MNYIYTSVLLFSIIFISTLNASDVKYTSEIVPKNMTVAVKKDRFYSLLSPAIKKVHAELLTNYKNVKNDIKNNKNSKKIEALKNNYKVKTNKELLAALKPHPQSIVLAQAAMESSWGTSRFFTKANNAFGIWSFNKNEPRIAAGEKRNGKKTIWLRKFNTIEESVRKYYRVMAVGRAYKEFRELRLKSDDVHKLVKKLDGYSEIGALYGKELSSLIRYNKLTKYD